MIREVGPESTITIATSESQIPQIRAQLGDELTEDDIERLEF